MDSTVRDTIEYDAETGAYRATFDGRNQRPGLALVTAVAAVDDLDETELAPLGGVLDVDAFDACLRSGGSHGTVAVTVTFSGYRATVRSDGDVVLRPTADGETGSSAERE